MTYISLLLAWNMLEPGAQQLSPTVGTSMPVKSFVIYGLDLISPPYALIMNTSLCLSSLNPGVMT